MTQNDSQCQDLHWQTAHSGVDRPCRPANDVTIQIWNLRAAEERTPGRHWARIRVLTAIIGALGVIVAAAIGLI
jgi:hypothetical protein